MAAYGRYGAVFARTWALVSLVSVISWPQQKLTWQTKTTNIMSTQPSCVKLTSYFVTWLTRKSVFFLKQHNLLFFTPGSYTYQCLLSKTMAHLCKLLWPMRLDLIHNLIYEINKQILNKLPSVVWVSVSNELKTKPSVMKKIANEIVYIALSCAKMITATHITCFNLCLTHENHCTIGWNKCMQHVLICCFRTLIGDLKFCDINIWLFKKKSNQ